MRDVRNVYLYRDKAQARRGHSVANSFLDDNGNPVSHIVLVYPMRSEQVGIVVGYQQTDREVHVFLVDGLGAGTNRVGTWFTLAAGAHEPPRILAAESYRKVFLAHDEPVIGKRAQTYYYDPFGATQLVGLTADLNGDATAEAVKFRGVQDYLSYLFGWGYGTGSDEDRPEIIRVSLPGNPLGWDPQHYFVAGVGDDPVLRCLPTADRLMVFKGSSQYEIIGYDRRTFGIKPGEQLHGLAASRLAIALDGVIYFWDASEGPRRTTGGASTDLAWPLDIDAPAPADLVAQGALGDGFATYLPGRRVVQFIFGRRCYNLSIWNPEEPKWSYGELAVPVFSGGLLYSGGEGGTSPPASAPSNVSGTGTAPPGNLQVSWTNNGLDGGEFAEVWLKPTGGTWSLKASVPASGATQSTTISGLLVGTNHSIAMRYRRGPYYSPGSSSGNPDDWPAGQKGSGTTTISAPTLDDTTWSRVSAVTEQVTLTWTNAHSTAQIKVFRNGVLIATLAAGTTSYNDQTISGETTYAYKLRHAADIESADSNTISQWTGPDLKPTLVSLTSDPPAGWTLTWTNGDASLETEVWLRNITDGIPYALRTTVAAGVTVATGSEPGQSGDTIGMNARHKKTTFGVDDFSPFNGGTGNPVLDELTVVLA